MHISMSAPPVEHTRISQWVFLPPPIDHTRRYLQCTNSTALTRNRMYAYHWPCILFIHHCPLHERPKYKLPNIFTVSNMVKYVFSHPTNLHAGLQWIITYHAYPTSVLSAIVNFHSSKYGILYNPCCKLNIIHTQHRNTIWQLLI